MSDEEELVQFIIDVIWDQLATDDVEYDFDKLAEVFDSEIKRIFKEEKPYHEQDYEEAKKQELDLDKYSDYIRYYEMEENAE